MNINQDQQLLTEKKISDQDTAQLCTAQIIDGKCVVINQEGTVYGLTFDPRNTAACNKACLVKNRCNKPISIQSSLETIQKIVDLNRVDQKLVKIITETELLKKFTRMRLFLRIPILEEFSQTMPKLCQGMADEDLNTVHVMSATNDLAKNIEIAILEALSQKYPDRIPILGITSFNETGAGSQNDPELSRQLAQKHQISLLIHPDQYLPGLSYDVVSFLKNEKDKIYRGEESVQTLVKLQQIFDL